MTGASRFRSYPSYRGTNAHWIERSPSHWDDRRSDTVLTVQRRQLDPSKFSDQQVFHYSIPAVQEHGDGQLEEGGNLSSGKLVIDSRVVLISKLNPRKATVVLAYPREKLTLASTEFVPLKATRCHDWFLYYLVSSEGFRQLLDARVQSVTRSHQRVNPEDIAKFHFAWPPEGEQRAIVAFLGRETARIDALITKKRHLIELLQEKRAAIVAQAVTHGIQAGTQLSESGVPWFDRVPAHWDVKRLRFLTPGVTVGIVVTPTKYYEDEGIPALRSFNVKPGAVDDQGLAFISEESNQELSKSQLREGDLVSVRTGNPGTTAVVPKKFHGSNCIDLIITRRSIRFDSTFLCFFMNSTAARVQFEQGSGGALQQHFNIETAKNLVIPTPPLAEQRQIASYLVRSTETIDRLMTTVEKAVDRLCELRSALISAAVTGQIDIREAA